MLFIMASMKPLARTLLTGLALGLILSGCKGPASPYCPGREPLDDAADYQWQLNGRRYFEPLNAWTRHQALETLLLKTYREGGLDALRSRYGLDCKSRDITPPCNDCFVCRRTIPKTVAPAELEAHACQVGEMTVQVDIGPQWTMAVMTYWDRLPVGAPVPYPPSFTPRRPR